jgi:CRP-like cAMP-binding protein
MVADAIVRQLRPHQSVIRDGFSRHYVGFVRVGRIRHSLQNGSFSKIMLFESSRFDVFDNAILSGDCENRISSVATTPAEVLLIKKGRLMRMAREYPSLRIALLRSEAATRRKLVHCIRTTVFYSVEQRICRFLASSLSSTDSDAASTALTGLSIHDFGDIAGCNEKYAAKVLYQLARDGVIALERGRVGFPATIHTKLRLETYF